MSLTGALPTRPEDRRVEIHWPDPLPIDEGEQLRNAQIKAQLGLPVERILAEYGDKINYVCLDYPLVIHPRAVPASEAALCAADQDRYWDYHQHLMIFNGPLDNNGLMARAKDLEMDVAKFQACYVAQRCKR